MIREIFSVGELPLKMGKFRLLGGSDIFSVIKGKRIGTYDS
jgi:hypothetical protein